MQAAALLVLGLLLLGRQAEATGNAGLVALHRVRLNHLFCLWQD